ncbi:MAG: hypothetical protein AAF662_13325 [Pseudomonadota bacterium]
MSDSEPLSPELDGLPPRDVPRFLAYPLLIVMPILCIWGGIKLGSNNVLAHLMLSSQNGTPVENWTVSLIAVFIALFSYLSWAYGNRTFRVRWISFIFALIYIVTAFVFGIWGIFAWILPCLPYLWNWFRYRRRLAKVELPSND